jgi:predicted phage-related endonuclease
MIANLDGVCRCRAHGKCIFEAKTANAFKAGEWEGDAVPQEYILQIQHYLCVTGYNGAYIAVLVGGNAFQCKFVPRDEEVITMLIRYERDFWSHVQDDVPPPPDGSKACVKFLAGRYPRSVPKSKIKLPAAAADLIHQYSAADEQLGQITKEKQRAGNLLKEMLGENEIGIIGDSFIAWRNVVGERFDSKAFESEQPEIYKKYVRKSSHRRFTVKAASKPGENTEANMQQYRKAG